MPSSCYKVRVFFICLGFFPSSYLHQSGSTIQGATSASQTKFVASGVPTASESAASMPSVTRE